MRQIVIVSGVLGGGSALVFAVAAVVATLFPSGTLVTANAWGSRIDRAMPAVGGPLIVNDDFGSGVSGPVPITVGANGDVPPDVALPVPSPES